MKAAVYTAVRTIEFQDRPMLKAGPGEVVVKIKYCGICGTDLHIYFEGILPPGIVLGHENVGTVAKVGEGVEGWEDVRKCLNYLATGRFKAKGLLSDIIPLGDLVEKGFNRLVVDRNLIKVAVAPQSGPGAREM
jgi:threonine dehydrogenase-like Zn-dependent dehydrogenase